MAETYINSVSWQVSRNGILTPVAHVEPVFLDGTVISRVNLHNSAEIARLDLKINSKVLIKRAGGVIPKIVRTVKESND